ncbi:hypothetical protein M413DRAFT_31696 [Hebeloma cylindrosporum]|uniref:Uncharacterized protein n=1 Tax=Hebeloma cylindrosporum TaxID=76867 RepID=A0A0C2XEU4_HEBCY|nr:hypothetical protein M413DRAFT_31696 [Hebeloma cylindrosporum h7]
MALTITTTLNVDEDEGDEDRRGGWPTRTNTPSTMALTMALTSTTTLNVDEDRRGGSTRTKAMRIGVVDGRPDEDEGDEDRRGRRGRTRRRRGRDKDRRGSGWWMADEDEHAIDDGVDDGVEEHDDVKHRRGSAWGR